MTAELLSSPPPLAEPVPRVLVSALEGMRSSVVEGLREEGLAVLVAPPGRLAEAVLRGGVDLVVLHSDLVRARAELAELRAVSPAPVLVALRETRSSVEVFLEAGADDCVTSSVSRTELVARVRAVLRRRHRPADPEVLRAGPFVMDVSRHVFLCGDTTVHLAPKEFGLLELLIRRDGRVVTREEALALVWGVGRTGDPSTVDVHVKRLRSKIEPDPAHPEWLLTVRGLGYRFVT